MKWPSRYRSIAGNVNFRFLTIMWTSAGEIRRAFDKPKDEGEANGWLIDEAKSRSVIAVCGGGSISSVIKPLLYPPFLNAILSRQVHGFFREGT
jgi:hypothetical protein